MALIFASVWSLNAQGIGIRGGYGFSGLNGEAAYDTGIRGKSGFYVGGFFEIPILSFLAIQPEVVFAKQGAKWLYTESGNTNSAKFNMNYINVPVLAKLKVGNLGFLGGAQLGYLVNTPYVAFIDNGKTVSMNKDDFARFDFGIAAGIEFKITQNILMDIRFYQGLTNTFDTNNASLRSLNISDNNDFKNVSFTAGLGIMF